MEEIASGEVLQIAFQWLCKRRKDYPVSDEVWWRRWRWPQLKGVLRAVLLAGQFRFSPLQRVRGRSETYEIWHALYSPVLKA
jgi:hypothetical protein